VQSCSQIVTINKSTPSFIFTGKMPFLSPTESTIREISVSVLSDCSLTGNTTVIVHKRNKHQHRKTPLAASGRNWPWDVWDGLTFCCWDPASLRGNVPGGGESRSTQSAPFSRGTAAATVRSYNIHTYTLHHAGSGVERIDLLHFLAWCHKRRLNQAQSVLS